MDDGIRVYPSSEPENEVIGHSQTVNNPNQDASQAGGAGAETEGEAEAGGGAQAQPRSGPSFECNICFETANDPVVTQCGHLFCWDCLHQWINHTEANPAVYGSTCPVCKAGVTKDNIIPVYARDSDSRRSTSNTSTDKAGNGQAHGSTDAPTNTPHRPQGRRPEVEPNMYHNANNAGGGVQFSAGFGGLGFGFPFFQFNLGNGMGMNMDGPGAGPFGFRNVNGNRNNGAQANPNRVNRNPMTPEAQRAQFIRLIIMVVIFLFFTSVLNF